MKKFISILLAILTVATCFAPPIAVAVDEKCDCGNAPMIYIYGRQNTYDDPSSPDRVLLNDVSDDELSGLLTTVLPYLKDAVLKNDYDEYCRVVVDEFKRIIGDFGLSKEGELKDNSGIDYYWTVENPTDFGRAPENERIEHTYNNVYSYVFNYDARRDPFAVADDLKVFVDAVKEVSGHDTVNILSRCMGSEYALAYFVKYGWSDIETFVQNCSSANGTDVMSELFAGKIKLDAAAIDRFETEALPKEGKTEEEHQFTQALISLLNQAKTLGIATSVINKIYKKVYKQIIPEIMISEYGTCPGYWSMVSSKDYEDAKSLIFGGREEEYSVLIEKLDNYDRLVRSQTDEILTKMHDDGVKLCTIVKYGFQLQPLTESASLESDDKISVKLQSYGATTANHGSTFSKKYVKAAQNNGTAEYISPDNVIDASTCLFPDTTWFMKDIRHNNFPGCVNELYIAACQSEKELTVNDDARFPQFLRHFYWENSIVPLTDENQHLYTYTSNIFKAFFNFVKLLWNRIFHK